MFKYPLLLVCFLLLGGCVATTPYGNYVDGESTALKTIAEDLAHQLTERHPPASTQFNMQHSTEDSFGVALTKQLRAGGYAIHDYRKATLTEPSVDLKAGTALAYILDESNDIYRLSVVVDQHVLTRAYKSYKGAMYPAGSWAYKE